jgi:hypothetical protein
MAALFGTNCAPVFWYQNIVTSCHTSATHNAPLVVQHWMQLAVLLTMGCNAQHSNCLQGFY